MTLQIYVHKADLAISLYKQNVEMLKDFTPV